MTDKANTPRRQSTAAKTAADKAKAAAEAKAKAEAKAAEDKVAAEAKAKAEAKAAEDKAAAAAEAERPEPTITVVCSIPDGRRRAGRRWDGGKTEVPASALDEGQLAELEADPLLQVLYEGR